MARGERQNNGEEGSAHGGDGIGRGGKDIVRIGEVVEQGHEDEHEAKAKGDAGEHGRHEGDAALGGPAEPEEGDDEAGSAEEGEGQTTGLLTLGPGAAAGGGADEDVVPVPEDGEGEEGAAADGEVAQAGGAGGEGVELLEDDREGLEGHVEDGVAEGEVGAGGGDDGLGEEHAQGPGEDDGEKLVEVCRLELAGGDDTRGRVLLAQLLSAPGEEDGAKGLGEEEYHGEGDGREHDADPEGPAPADGIGAKAGYDGGEEGPKDCGLWERVSQIYGSSGGTQICSPP